MSQKNKKREFMDKNHPVMENYYEFAESGYTLKDMKDLIKRDPDFYDPYLTAAGRLRELGREAEACKLEDEAFKRARARIEDKNRNWPDKMPWAWLENRHIFRALMTGVDNLWKDGKTSQALDVYRKLLHLNLSDNIGARFAIIALRLGLSYDEYVKQVWPEPTMSAEHIDKWFKKNAPKFPEELKEWKRYCKEELGLDEKYLP